MARSDSEENRSVALYWDFENLHAGIAEAKFGEGYYNRPDNRFKPQEALIDIQAIVELASSFGPVAINRAYCNWQWYGRYRDALLQSAVELIQLFSPGASAKNGADIKLCLDATEDMSRFDHLGTIIIVGGDSDFMPVAQKIKAAGRTLVGISTRPNTKQGRGLAHDQAAGLDLRPQGPRTRQFRRDGQGPRCRGRTPQGRIRPHAAFALVRSPGSSLAGCRPDAAAPCTTRSAPAAPPAPADATTAPTAGSPGTGPAAAACRGGTASPRW